MPRLPVKRIIAIVVPLVLIGGLIVWRFNQKSAQEAMAQAGPGGGGGGGGARGGGAGGGASGGRGRGASNVELAVAAPKDLVRTLDTVGSVDSPYNVKLSPKTAGRIDYLEVREGAAVTTGQVLVKVDPTEIEGQVLQQQAAVAEAQSRLAQAQLTQGSTTVGITTTIEQQQANLASMQADYDQVRENYSAQVAAAQSTVTDAQARVASAEAALANAKASVASAEANLANAKTKYQRIYSLYQQGFIAAQDVDDARTTMEVQQAALKVAQGQLDAASSAIKSAQAVRNSAANNAKIVARKGVSDIAAAKARVTQASAQLRAASANRSQGPAYEANLAALRSSVNSAQAQLRQAEARRADTVLRSPIDGIVTARAADPGAIASSGTAVLTIQFLKWVYVTTSVPVEYSRTITVGTPVSFSVDALPGKTFDATIAEVNPAADPQNRQFTVRLKLDNPGLQLRPGMYARLHIVLERVHAVAAVPREAVKIARDGTKTVFTVDASNVAHEVKVVTGAEDSQSIEIKEGIHPGDKVVSLSYTPVKDGQQISQGRPGGSRGGAGGAAGGAGRGGNQGGRRGSGQ